MTDDPLLAELYERPDDPAPYLVYGDVLLARGDPRGELIAVQSAGRDATPLFAAHPLAALPNLRLLNLTRTAITPAGIDRLAELPTLTTVFVNACDPATIARARQIAHWTVGDAVEGFDDQR